MMTNNWFLSATQDIFVLLHLVFLIKMRFYVLVNCVNKIYVAGKRILC